MKVRAVGSLVLLVLATLLLLGEPNVRGQQTPYQETVRVVVAGNNALWVASFAGGNVSLPALKSAYSQLLDVDSFELFGAKTTEWRPENELLTRLIDDLAQERIPLEGIFLRIESGSAEAAARAADTIGVALALNFVDYMRLPKFSIFYSHADFDYFVENYLWGAIDSLPSGFVGLFDRKSFLASSPPMFKLASNRSGEGFINVVSIYGAKSSAFSGKLLKATDLFPAVSKTNSSLSASRSLVQVDVFGSLIESVEGGDFTNNLQTPSSRILIQLAPGQRLPRFNATLLQNFPSLVVTRELDRGSLFVNGTVEVRMKLRNAGPRGSPAAENITINETWWTPYFEKVAGNSSETIARLDPGETRFVVYQLRLKSAESRLVSQPEDQNLLRYSYLVAGKSVSRVAKANPVEMAINLVKSALRVEATPANTHPGIGGDPGITISVFNSGDRSAFNLRAFAGSTVVGSNETLPPGQKWSIKAKVAYTGLKTLNRTLEWIVKWVDEGLTREITSNTVSVNHNPSSVIVPFVKTSKSFTIVELSGATYANATLSVSNEGPEEAANIQITDLLPAGFTYVNGTVTNSTRGLVSEVATLGPGQNKSWQYLARLARSENFVVPPASAVYSRGDDSFLHFSPSQAIPLGVKLSQTLSLATALQGSHSVVEVKIENVGSKPVSKVVLKGGTLSAAEISQGNNSQTVSELPGSSSASLQYTLKMLKTGNFTLPPATASFTFAGRTHLVRSASSALRVFPTPSIEILLTPSQPIEQQIFKVLLVVKNLSPLPLTDVRVKVSLPPELRMVNGSLEVSGEVLPPAPAGVLQRSATVVAERSLDSHIHVSEIAVTYAGDTLTITPVHLAFNVGDDVPTRYGIPVTLAILVALGTILLGRRAAGKGRLGQETN